MEESTGADISHHECLALLRSLRVGRIIFEADGPQIRPVNYFMSEDRIVLRMDRRLDDELHVIFEIDSYDTVGKKGWSVIAQGRAFSRPVESSRDTDLLEPWAPGSKLWSITIEIESISGRWVHRRSDDASESRGYI
jgi:nitroimidazol reductase NimA-like FMN-containing flavoprotein (pyridoxamine 5'-phosphate oxidase superfamily)